MCALHVYSGYHHHHICALCWPVIHLHFFPVQNLSRLEEKEKEVVSALRYFKTIIDKMVVDRKVLEMLPGSASKVLEAIVPVVQIDPKILKR